MATPIKYITGQRFNKLVVLSLAGKDAYGNATWLCQCDCGNKKVIVGMNLRKNMTTSCGCLHKEIAKKLMTDMNTIHNQSYTKEYKTHNSNMYRFRKTKQMPKWASKDKIKEIYMNRPNGYQVDHIIPLKGEFVSGLHVENNLQYLSAFDNRSKNNSFIGV
jgi:hypothetical protein